MADGDIEKNKILVELCKIQLDRYKHTRDIRFKISLSIWTLIIATGAFFYTNSVEINTWCLIIISFIVLLFYWLWMSVMQSSMEIDKRYFELFRVRAVENFDDLAKNIKELKNCDQATAENIIYNKSNNGQNPSKLFNFLQKRLWRWAVFETLITAILLLLVSILLLQQNNRDIFTLIGDIIEILLRNIYYCCNAV